MNYKVAISELVSNVFNETVSEEVITNTMAIAKEVYIEKGDVILGIGEPQTKTYFILNGIARSYYLDKEGNDVTKNFMKENTFCIGESLFTQEKSMSGYEVLENITALQFDAMQLKNFMLRDSTLTKIYIKMLEQTVIYKMNRENGFQLKSATERYLDFKREYSYIEDRVNQSYIASYIGITPVSLSRIRRTIKEES